MERSLEIDALVHGTEEHPSVAASLHNLAALLSEEGRPQEAVSIYQRVIEIEHVIYGTKNHYSTVETEISLALLLTGLERSEEAIPLLHHAMEVLQKQVPNHPLLHQLREMFASAESSTTEAAEDASLDLNALVQSVIMARHEGGHLSDDSQAMLKVLSEAGSPHDQVADFLKRLVSEATPPEVPVDLPDQVVQFLVQVRELAWGDSVVHED